MRRGRTLHWTAWLALAWQVPAAGADQCGEMEWGGWGQAGPELEQLSTTSVNVSWNNSIPTACASENLFVTYYKSSPYLVFGPENKIENDTLEMVVMQKNFSSVVIEDHIEPGQNYSFQVTIAVADRNWSSPLSHITIHDDEGKEDNENVDSEGLRRRCERGETAAPDGCACPAGWGGPACAVSHLTKTTEYRDMRPCPFPAPASLAPACTCLVDTQYDTHLVCHLHHDFTKETFNTISRAYGCKKHVSFLKINLNGNRWSVPFAENTTGQFRLKTFHLSNFSSIDTDIMAGAFNSSKFTLEEFTLSPGNAEKGKNDIQSEAFVGLVNLKTIDLGNSFSKISRASFSDLPKLQSVKMEKKTLEKIESGAFSNVGVTELDFSDQLLAEIPSEAFTELEQATVINFSGNQLKQIAENAFVDSGPNVVTLNLSNNVIQSIGNVLSKLTNQNLEVDLTDNNIMILSENAFKPFIETSKGHINLSGNPLQCLCDVKWLILSNFMWSKRLLNANCHAGVQLETVKSINTIAFMGLVSPRPA